MVELCPSKPQQMATSTIIAKLEIIFGDQKAALYARKLAARHKAEKAIRATQNE